MNYKVLYRKYRPNFFDDVVGQSTAVNLLKESINNDKISHAYLFSGPRGTGKTSCAKIFAKAINCLQNKDGNPCGKCENCINFNQISDVYEIDAASNNGVDQIREIIDNIKLLPIHSKYKVYIIDEVHMLSTSAFNALLLTLEEPPSHVVFILATTDVENVPITVLSRCQRIDFKKISEKDVISRLKFISNAENIDITDDAIDEIAQYCDGGLRDALSLLDQSYKFDKKITRDVIYEIVGSISLKDIKKVIEFVDIGNVEGVSDILKKCRNNSIDYKNFIKKLVNEIRNFAILIKTNKVNNNISYDGYKNMALEIAQTIYKCNVNIDSFDLLELILLSYMKNEFDSSLETKKDVSSEPNLFLPKEEKSCEQTKNLPNINKLLNFQSTRINNCFVGANKDDLNAIKQKYDSFLDNIELKSLKGLLLDTSIVLASDKIAVIKTKFDTQTKNINESILDIEDAFNKFYDVKYKFVSVSEERWEKEMDKYKKNKKNKISYVMVEENDNIDYDICDIFLSNKIEIK